MDIGGMLELAGQFGPMGLLVAYLIWDGARRDRQQRERDAARAAVDERDIESREKLASSLTALSLAITGRPHV